MNKLITLLIIVLTAGVNAQKLTLKDLINICNKNNWETSNSLLINKGWKFHNAKQGDDETYNITTWSFEKSYYDDTALGWFKLYSAEDAPNKVSLEFFNKTYYTTLYNSLNSNGFKFDGNEIFDGSVVSEYSNSDFELTITTEARKDDEYQNTTVDSYTFFLKKKMSLDFMHNGPRVRYFEDDNTLIEMEGYVKNDKLDGELKLYYKNGVVKKVGYYINGLENGKFIERNEDGILTAEYHMLNGEPDGKAIEYDDNGKIERELFYKNGEYNGKCVEYFSNGNPSIIANYKNGNLEGAYTKYNVDGQLQMQGNYIDNKGNGLFVLYYEDGSKMVEYTELNDETNGLYTTYFYNDETSLKPNAKETVNYVNGQKNGIEKFIYIDETKDVVVSHCTYVNGLKEGKFQEFINDSLVFGSYLNGKYHGFYKIYYKPLNLLFNKIPIIDTTKQSLITEGNYSQGEKNGQWEFYDLNRNIIKKGSYKNNLKEGEWLEYVQDFGNNDSKAKKYVGTILNKFNYANGELDGTSESFGENVEYYVKCNEQFDVKSEINDSCVAISFIPFKLIGNFKNGKLQGKTKKFDKDNTLVLECNYEQDELDGEWYKKNEVYYEKGSYKNGLKTGKWTYYILDNNLFREEEYIQDKLEGDIRSFDNAGNKIYIQKYSNDLFLSGEYYDENNKISSEIKLEKENILHITTYNNDFLIKTTYKVFCDLQKYKYENIKEKSNELIENNDLIKNGKYYVSHEGKIECEGEYLLGKKQGIWAYKYLQEGVVNNLGYNNGVLTNETFQELKNNKQFNGTFEKVDEQKNIREEIKIKGGVRNGNTKTYDLKTGELIEKKKYKNGVVED